MPCHGIVVIIGVIGGGRACINAMSSKRKKSHGQINAKFGYDYIFQRQPGKNEWMCTVALRPRIEEQRANRAIRDVHLLSASVFSLFLFFSFDYVLFDFVSFFAAGRSFNTFRR